MNSIRLCITGGSGFIGTTAVQWAVENYLNVINFDIQPPKILQHYSYWRYIDIRKTNELNTALQVFNPTHILNLAATTGMNINDISYFDANINGVQNLLDATTNLPNLLRIMFTSSLLVCINGHVPKKDTEYCPP